jgi:hypothetical protein
MYSKEEIVKEIKRVAKELGVKKLSQQDFMMHSRVPLTTVKYYTGTWEQAVALAELDAGESEEVPVNKELVESDDMLKELIRLYNETGKEPTPGLVNTKGAYGEVYYKANWNTLHEAFIEAKKKFPSRMESPKKDTNEDSGEIYLDELTFNDTSAVFSDVLLPEPEKRGAPAKKKKAPKPAKKVQKIPAEKPSIKFIPETIKPAKPQRAKNLGKQMDFRGLRHEPINREGVMFIFGMIATELGFVITSISDDFPAAEGRRCVDIATDNWEEVELDFYFLSSDLKKTITSDSEFDIVICWKHDWPDCPLEVLELKSIIKELENYNQ